MLLALRGVEVGYHRRRILPPVTLDIDRGTYLGIVGPNGSGKTTLVRTMLGLIPPVTGRVEHPAGRPPRFGYVPQRSEHDVAFPLTAFDLALMGRTPRLGLLRPAGRRDRDITMTMLGRVGLAGLELRPLATLSGGQRQRALIARALASEPEVLVLDEPTTGMDIVAERALLDLIEELRTGLDLGVVVVSHQLGMVAGAAREVLLVDGERQIVEHGAVDEVVTAARLSVLYDADVRVTVDAAGHPVVRVASGGAHPASPGGRP